MKLQYLGSLLILLPLGLGAQSLPPRSEVPLNNWPAPRHWQRPSGQSEQRVATPEFQQPGGTTSDILVFVPMTPCRLADTRSGSGYPALGSTPLASLTPRTLQLTGACGLPNNYVAAEAYSLNVTVVPPSGTPGGYLVVYPNPVSPVPLAASLTWNANAAFQTNAVIAAATPSDGSVNVVARFPTDVVIDINGYYAPTDNSYANLGLGSGTLGSNSTSGNWNTAVGDEAMAAFVSGDSNTALGADSLLHDATGSGNIAIGYLAGVNLTANSNNILIGNQGTSSDDHAIRIGDVQTATYIAGIYGSLALGGAPVYINSNGQLGTATILLASLPDKDAVRDVGDASSGLLHLRPVICCDTHSGAGSPKQLQYRLIAEEVANVFPDLVTRGAGGQVESMRESELPVLLLNELQKQYRHIQQQDEVVRRAEQQLAEQKELNRKLEARLAAVEAFIAQMTPSATADTASSKAPALSALGH